MSDLHGIHDLIPPAPPPAGGLALWAAIAITTLCLAALGACLWPRLPGPQRQQKWRARRRLKRISSRPDGNSARYIAQTLAAGLGLIHIGPRTPLPEPLTPQRRRWLDFTQRLSHAGYAPGQPTPGDLDTLISEARYWLRAWP